MDIGGHRFFSKSTKIIEWWLNILPLETNDGENIEISYQNKSQVFKNTNLIDRPSNPDNMMMLRDRHSRIFYDKKFFPYPITWSFDTLIKLGPFKVFNILRSY